MELKEAKDKESKELRVNLEPEIFDKIETIKEHYGIKNMTELIRFLITKIEREIQYTKIELQEKRMKFKEFIDKWKETNLGELPEELLSKKKTD